MRFRPPRPSGYYGRRGEVLWRAWENWCYKTEGIGGNACASRALRGALGKETPISVREHPARATFPCSQQ